MQNAEIKVSVIITAYNQEKYIEKTIQSVLAQKVSFPIELLIGDDGSSDNTVSIILRYAKQHPEQIIPVCNKANVGASHNFYHLLQMARGQYIATLEGDDYWTDPHKLSKQVEYLDRKPEASGCVHDTQLVNRLGIPLQTQKLAWVKARAQSDLRNFDGEHLPGHASSLVFRNFMRERTHDFWIITAHQQISDRCIFLVLLTFGTVEHIPQCMSAYRILRSGDDQNMTRKLFLSRQNVFYSEMELLSSMERWLFQECGISKHFIRAKSRVFAAFLFGRNSKNHRSAAAAMTLLRESGHPLSVLTVLPFSTVEKIILNYSNVNR